MPTYNTANEVRHHTPADGQTVSSLTAGKDRQLQTDMNAQRLRNLTTSLLHTNMADIYEDLGWITGESGLMTHMLPRALKACMPWLRKHVTDRRFWDGKFDLTHAGEINLPTPTTEEREEMFRLYAEQPDPLAGKKVILVKI